MRKNIPYLLTGILLAVTGLSVSAQTTSVFTNPEGMMTYTFPKGTSYVSFPLTSDPVYSGAISAFTANTISVADPGPFVTPTPVAGETLTDLSQLAAPGAPYFVKFLSGNEKGRVILVTANTTDTLTLDTTDNTTQTVALNAAGFSVAIGDSFEVFPGDTLASLFGDNTDTALKLTGGSSASADTVTVNTISGAPAQGYYFNTGGAVNAWNLYPASTGNKNNTVIYPYSAVTISIRSANVARTISMMGRPTEVPLLNKTLTRSAVYTSSQYAFDVPLSQLQFSNWTTGTTTTANTISLWDATALHYDAYYEDASSNWHLYPSTTDNQNSFKILAGSLLVITNRATVSGATSYFQSGSALPYGLTY